MSETRRCPYCAEEIQAKAVRCPCCRSRLVTFDAHAWHRDHPESRLAGVCACLAHVLAMPVAAVRLGFVLFTLFLHIAPLLYVGLWLILPERAGGQSPLERVLRRALDFIGGDHRRRDGALLPPPSEQGLSGRGGVKIEL